MGLIINKLYIKNFKVFEDVTIDFSQKKLTVFDGPNGFGKTTIYDAIELLFTGRIRRYDSLNNIIDNRENYVEIPFYNVNGDGTPIVIKAEIEIGNGADTETKVLIRKTEDKASLSQLKAKHDFSVFKLFETESFDSQDEDYNTVDNQNQFLKDILGENYRENFEFLNYVEQEESYYMLKHKDKDRKNNILHLFNAKEFQNQLAKIKAVRQQIHKLLAPLNKDISDLEGKTQKVKENLSENEEAEYKKLFKYKELLWDKKEVDFEMVSYTDVLGKEGVLANLERLVSNRDTFKTSLKNSEIQKVIDESLTVLNQVLKFNDYAEKQEVVLNEKSLLNSIARFVDNSKSIDATNITDGSLDIDTKINKKFSKEEIISYSQKLKSIKELVKNSNKASKLHSDMSSTRNNLIEYFKQYDNASGEENESCPLCGYNWGKQEDLLIQIGIQTEELEKLSDNFSKNLTDSIKEFKEQEFRKVLDMLNKYKAESFFNERYFIEFTDIAINKLQSAKKYLQDNGIEFTDLINKDTNPETEIKIDILISRIKEKIVEINTEKIHDNFNELFSIHFDDKEDMLFAVDVKELGAKQKYIAWQYSLYQSSQLTKFTKKLSVKRHRLGLLKDKESDLKKLEKEYNDSLKSYNAEVIKDIELLFHIYTGRILLDYQGGLGLFIKNDNDGLRFVTNPNQTYDALFSMSAGQLSALIISFTLALNKIYSINKVIFIDDPVQTMDEINIAGFIELLRNEFADRQIFISTHESMMSTYMRYKFEKYNLSTKRINVKEINNLPTLN